MGKASSSKKVARAATTGGGRTVRGRRPYGWYSLLTVFVLGGVFLVAFSRHQQQAAASVHPSGADHWHSAYGIDICGTFQPNLPQNPNLSSSPAPGIHTHGDGLIHIEPFTSGSPLDAGTHATLARFAQNYPNFKLTSKMIQIPGGKAYHNGDRCDGKPAQMRFRVWNPATAKTSITYTNPSNVRLRDQQGITIAFLPANDNIPKPPAQNLAQLAHPGEGPSGTSAPPVSTPAVPISPATSTPPTPTSPGSTTGGSPPTSGP